MHIPQFRIGESKIWGAMKLNEPGRQKVGRYLFLFPACSRCFVVLSYHGREVYSFTTDGYGIFNVRAHFGCVPYTRRGGGSGTNEVCIGVDSEGQRDCISPDPVRGSNPWFADLNSESLTSELRPPLPPRDPDKSSHGIRVAFLSLESQLQQSSATQP